MSDEENVYVCIMTDQGGPSVTPEQDLYGAVSAALSEASGMPFPRASVAWRDRQHGEGYEPAVTINELLNEIDELEVDSLQRRLALVLDRPENELTADEKVAVIKAFLDAWREEAIGVG